MLSHSEPCKTSSGRCRGWWPTSLLPCTLTRATQHPLQPRRPRDKVHLRIRHMQKSLGGFWKAFAFPIKRVRPFSFFPPGTQMVCLVRWWPSKSPEKWPRESQGWWPRTLTSVVLLSQLSHCQQLPPSGLLVKQEKTEPYLLKLILLVFSLTCHWTHSSMINLLIGLSVSSPKPWWSIQHPTAIMLAGVTS